MKKTVTKKSRGWWKKNCDALGRTKNSARFEPYFKLEQRDTRLSVWKPVGKSFATIASARSYARTICSPYRLLRVSENRGYEIIEETTL